MQSREVFKVFSLHSTRCQTHSFHSLGYWNHVDAEKTVYKDYLHFITGADLCSSTSSNLKPTKELIWCKQTSDTPINTNEDEEKKNREITLQLFYSA